MFIDFGFWSTHENIIRKFCPTVQFYILQSTKILSTKMLNSPFLENFNPQKFRLYGITYISQKHIA